jgi:hypothetical protein
VALVFAASNASKCSSDADSQLAISPTALKNMLQLRMTIVPHQVRWPAPEYLHWQRLHEAANEARSRVSKFYRLADEIDRTPGLSREGKYPERSKIADVAIADFEASKTLARAREAVEFATAKLNWISTPRPRSPMTARSC